MDPLSLLEQLSLSPRAARIYIGLLQLGRGTASQVAAHAKIPRSSLYPFLKELVECGLVTKKIIPEGPVYTPSSPDYLGQLIENQRKSLTNKERILSELIKVLTPLLSNKRYSIPQLEIVEGKKEVEALLYRSRPRWIERYKQLGETTMWGYQDHSFVSEYRAWHEDAWKKREPWEHIALFSTKDGVAQQKRERIERRELKLLPYKKEFPCSIWIHADHILFAMTRSSPHYAVLLVDVVIAEALRALFQMLWVATPSA